MREFHSIRPRTLLALGVLATLALGILPGPLMDLCMRAITASM